MWVNMHESKSVQILKKKATCNHVGQSIFVIYRDILTYCNPAPVEVGSFSHYLQGFKLHFWWLIGISEPSTVSLI